VVQEGNRKSLSPSVIITAHPEVILITVDQRVQRGSFFSTSICSVMNTMEDQSQGEGSGRESMDIDVMATENIKHFRHNSLALVVYPWATGVVMEPDLLNIFDQDHFAFVSSTSKAFIPQIQ
jgi:hypothetical protein